MNHTAIRQLRIPTDMVIRSNYSNEAYIRMSDLPKILKINEINHSVTIKRVIFNPPATIVLWNDGTKTVVKCSENDAFDKEKGLAMAIVKRTNGNTGSYFDVFKEYCHNEIQYPDFRLPMAEKEKENIKEQLNTIMQNRLGILAGVLTDTHIALAKALQSSEKHDEDNTINEENVKD